MGIFKYEDDLRKHYVRTSGWLPVCRGRLAAVRAAARKEKHVRRLRYFTFCAIGAIDVLMLDVARVIRRSNDDEFDTVVFFDRGPLEILETQKRIPGARGYTGDFVDLVLLPDPDEEAVLDGLEHLEPPAREDDLADVRERQRRLAERQDFIREFPFDVINLDLEGFFFRRNDPFPGRMVKALSTMLRWQQRPVERSDGRPESLGGFSLMFTTKVGPPDLTEDYLVMLRQAIGRNLQRDDTLKEALRVRGGTEDVATLERNSFEVFFKIALPKLIAEMALREDWYVDAARGISLYEIERRFGDGGDSFKVLHLVLDVNRQRPPKNQRSPMDSATAEAREEYAQVSRQIFERAETIVTDELCDPAELRASLERIRARRRLYYPDEE
jgi:hypothetical protein